jgi:hypothetical protein
MLGKMVNKGRNMSRSAGLLVIGLLFAASSAMAQDLRYSWFEISFLAQDIDKSASRTDIAINQTVNISALDGSGVRFRGSLGTWRNFFAYIDFNSSDIDVDVEVNNAQGQFLASDEFDFTAVRGGIGYRWPLTLRTDVYGAVSYDSSNLDFGILANEDFDTDDTAVGGVVGLRSMISDKLELSVSARYSEVGDVDLVTGEFDADILFSVGFGYELVRGLSITGDFESGKFSSFSLGFRLDLDED